MPRVEIINLTTDWILVWHHCVCLFISKTYWRTHVSSPVTIKLRKSSPSNSNRSKNSWAIHFVLICQLFWSPSYARFSETRVSVIVSCKKDLESCENITEIWSTVIDGLSKQFSVPTTALPTVLLWIALLSFRGSNRMVPH